MKVPFYLLGLLIRFGPQHGYRMQQMVEDGIADFAKIKMPTLYYHLNKLSDQGYVRSEQDRDGNRPEKNVYHITDKGRAYFNELATQIMKTQYQAEFNHDGLLYFYDLMDRELLRTSLTSLRDQLYERIKSRKRHRKKKVNSKIPKEIEFLTNEIFNHHITHMETELQWLNEVLKGLFER